MRVKKNIRALYKYIVPVTILTIFLYHSYSVQSELQQKEEQTYITLKELSELAEKTRGIELPFWDKAMFSILDWFIPVAFVNKNETLKLLTKYKNEGTLKNRRIYIPEGKMAEVVIIKGFDFDSSNIKEPQSIPMGTVLSAFVISPFHVSDKPNQLRLKININSISCTANSDSILEANYESGTVAAKITSISCDNDGSKPMPLDAIALISGRTLT